VQIDLDTLPDDPAILQQMLRDVVATAAHQHVGAVRADDVAAGARDRAIEAAGLLREQDVGRHDGVYLGPAGEVEDRPWPPPMRRITQSQVSRSQASPLEGMARRDVRSWRSSSASASRRNMRARVGAVPKWVIR
jgi:hypothetical protein